MHEYRGVNPHDVLMQQGHRLPPIAFDIVLKLHPVLAVIVNSRQPVVDFARLEHKPILLGMGNYLFKHIFLLCHCLACIL